MFHTDELQKIIDQLQHAQVDGIGYFDTLLLILKLIALCAKPILFVICLILILIWIPKWSSYKLTPTPDNMKRYNCYFILVYLIFLRCFHHNKCLLFNIFNAAQWEI